MPLPLYKKPQSSILKIIGIAAGKGGVGKSFLACNLARAIQKKGKKVGLLDADLYGPSLKKMMPAEKGAHRMNERWVPALSEGIPLLSFAYFAQENEALSVRAPIATKLIDQFLNQTDWGPLEYLLIDFPPGTGDIPLTVSQKVRLEGVLLVTTPQEIALADVRRAAKAFLEMGVPLLGVIENMSYFIDASGNTHYPFGKKGGALLAEELKIPLLAEIPLDARLSHLSDKGQSLFEENPLQDIQNLFYTIAETTFQLDIKKEILKIAPHGPDSFYINWADGLKQRFSLAEFQTLCPCASCQGKGVVYEPARAIGILEAGRYALKIDYEKGCKNGIYTYEFLKKVGKPL